MKAGMGLSASPSGDALGPHPLADKYPIAVFAGPQT